MPAAAAAAITGFETFAAAVAVSAGAAFAYASVYVVTTIAINYGLSKLSQALAGKPRRGPGGTGNATQGPSREITVRGTIEPMQNIYGEVRSPGFIAFYGVSGDQNVFLHFVVAYAAHQCEDISDVWLDNRYIADNMIDTDGKVLDNDFHEDSDFGARLYVFRHLGAKDQTVDTTLNTALDVWDEDHRGAGVAYIHFRLGRSEDVWPTGAPNSFFALVKGRRLYDPRKDSTNGGTGSHRVDDATTWEYSNNWALCVRDYISGGSRWYGTATPEKRLCFGEDDERIDDEFTIAAANIADEDVTIPDGEGGTTTQKRYTCDVQLSCGDTHRENLDILKTAGVGNVTYVNGKYRIYAGAYDTPTVTLDEDDILGPLTVSTHTQGDELYNMVTGTFYDEDRDWSLSPFPSITNSSYETDDGGQRPRSIQLHATRTSYRAQRIAMIHLRQSRNKTTVRFERLSPKAMQISEHETFMVTLSEYGWSSKVFRCLDWDFMPDGFIAMTAREEASTAYTDPDDEDYAAPIEGTVDTPQYDEPDTPTNFTAKSMPEGIHFSWTASGPVNNKQIYVLYEHTSQTPFSSATEVWRGKSLSHLLQRSGQTERYYWVTSQLNGIESDATPVGNGLAAKPNQFGFDETFMDSFEHQDYSRFYSAVSGTPTATYPENGENGGHVLRFEGSGVIAWKKNIPYDPNSLYKMTVRARMVQAPTNSQDGFYAGVHGVDADGTTLINTEGSDTVDGQHYVAANVFDMGGVTLEEWQTFVGYFSGHSADPDPLPAPDITDPAGLYTGVRFIRPVIGLNYSGGDGIMEVDYIRIEKVISTDRIGPDAASEAWALDDDGPDTYAASPGVTRDVLTISFQPEGDGELTMWASLEYRGEDSFSQKKLGVEINSNPITLQLFQGTNDGTNWVSVSLNGTVDVEAGDLVKAGIFAENPAGDDMEFQNMQLRAILRKR